MKEIEDLQHKLSAIAGKALDLHHVLAESSNKSHSEVAPKIAEAKSLVSKIEGRWKWF
jgi:hypothetical protein